MASPIIRRTLFVVGLPTLLFALYVTYDDLGELQAPDLKVLAPAFGLSVLFLMLLARAWASLLPTALRRAATQGFYESQLAKYNPVGGVAQAASQVMLLDAEDRRASTGAMIASKATSATGGFTWAGVLALAGTELPPLLRVGLAATTVAAIAIAFRPVLMGALGMAAPISSKLDLRSGTPTQLALARSSWTSVVAVGLGGLAFALLTGATQPSSLLRSTAAFGVSWAASLIVVPLPGGIGLREVLLGHLTKASPEAVVVASLAFRLVQLSAELALIVGSRAAGRISRNVPDDPTSFDHS